tara:strand:- start:1315 stop:2574 length:1260 start_codon:yes stop_codon:yes gene_type:complete
MIKTFKFNNYRVGYRHVIADVLRDSELYDREETVFNLKEIPNSIEAFLRCEITEIENKDIEFYIIHLRKFGKYNLRELVPLKEQVAVYWYPGLYYKIHTGNDIFSQTGKLLDLNLLTDEDIFFESCPSNNTHLDFNPCSIFLITGDLSSLPNVEIDELTNRTKVDLSSRKYYEAHKKHFNKPLHTDLISLHDGRLQYLDRKSTSTLVYIYEERNIYGFFGDNVIADLENIKNNFNGNILILKPIKNDLPCMGFTGIPTISTDLLSTAKFLQNFVNDRFPKTNNLYFYSFCVGSYLTSILSNMCNATKSFVTPFIYEARSTHFLHDALIKKINYRPYENYYKYLMINNSTTKNIFHTSCMVNKDLEQYNKFFNKIHNEQILDHLKNLEFHISPIESEYEMANDFVTNKGVYKISEVFDAL